LVRVDAYSARFLGPFAQMRDASACDVCLMLAGSANALVTIVTLSPLNSETIGVAGIAHAVTLNAMTSRHAHLIGDFIVGIPHLF